MGFVSNPLHSINSPSVSPFPFLIPHDAIKRQPINANIFAVFMFQKILVTKAMFDTAKVRKKIRNSPHLHKKAAPNRRSLIYQLMNNSWQFVSKKAKTR